MSNESILMKLEIFLNEKMPWMFWKGEVFIFLICFFVFLGFLAMISVRKPSNPRTGFLKIPTTLGDRVFISIALLVIIMLIVCGIGLPWYVVFITGTPIIILILLKG